MKESILKILMNETLEEEVICESVGKGLVKPEIKWVGQGKYINPEDISILSWEVRLFQKVSKFVIS